jgi:peptidoglycan-associated lipoprotein
MIRRRSAVPLLLAVAVVAGACSHPAPAPAPAPAQATAAPAPMDSSRIRDSLANAKRTADSLAAERDREGAAVAAARNTLLAKIYFDFDKSDLTDQDRATLDAKLPILNANPGLRIRIEGNCDKRGQAEYNLALGQRRAATAKRYLTDHGIDASRIDLISYGAERPIAEGDTEEAYAQNRRDEFTITAGGDNLKTASR